MSAQTLAYLAPSILLAIALFLSYWQYKADEKKWGERMLKSYNSGFQRGKRAATVSGYILGFGDGKESVERILEEELEILEDLWENTEGTPEDFLAAYKDLRNG